MELLNQAIEFSKQFHKSHTRLTGESVSDHCERVVQMLQAEGVDDETLLCGAALHAVFKFDNSADMKNKLSEQFGKELVALLEDFQKLSDKKIKRSTPNEENQQYIIQTFLNLTENFGALLIRLADKLDNLNYSFAFTQEERDRTAERAMVIYAPVAKFIGMSGLSSKFENQAFKILYSADYFRISSYLEAIRGSAELLFEDINTFILDLLNEKNIQGVAHFRIKKPYSIFKKEQKYLKMGKKLSEDFSHLADVLAMRILVNTVEDCYAVDDLLKKVWNTVDYYCEDLIANPRPSGYRSLHRAFEIAPNQIMEVQIKTFEMHNFNEYGGASHVFYKVGSNFRNNLQKDPDWLKKLDYWEKTTQFEEKAKPFSDYIYVFTPKGDIIELPRGATVIDFAYAIHEDLGRNFVGASVNSGIAKASSVLNDGDVVVIRASKKPKAPSRDWLDFVTTSKARGHIKKELRLS